MTVRLDRILSPGLGSSKLSLLHQGAALSFTHRPLLVVICPE